MQVVSTNCKRLSFRLVRNNRHGDPGTILNNFPVLVRFVITLISMNAEKKPEVIKLGVQKKQAGKPQVIRLDDLIPKHHVSGGRRVLFGTAGTKGNNRKPEER